MKTDDSRTMPRAAIIFTLDTMPSSRELITVAAGFLTRLPARLE